MLSCFRALYRRIDGCRWVNLRKAVTEVMLHTTGSDFAEFVSKTGGWGRSDEAAAMYCDAMIFGHAPVYPQIQAWGDVKSGDFEDVKIEPYFTERLYWFRVTESAVDMVAYDRRYPSYTNLYIKRRDMRRSIDKLNKSWGELAGINVKRSRPNF